MTKGEYKKYLPEKDPPVPESSENLMAHPGIQDSWDRIVFQVVRTLSSRRKKTQRRGVDFLRSTLRQACDAGWQPTPRCFGRTPEFESALREIYPSWGGWSKLDPLPPKKHGAGSG